MHTCLIQLGRLLVSALLVLFFFQGKAQDPQIGDSRTEIAEILRMVCRNENYYKERDTGLVVPATFVEVDDTLMYNVPGDGAFQLKYVLADDECVGINMRFTCIACLNLTYRKWLFKGRWRMDDSGYLYRMKNPARARIKNVQDFPFLYEVQVTRMESPPSKEALRRMRKVKKKRLGTRHYPMKRHNT